MTTNQTHTPQSQGIDTIQLIAKYEVFKKIAEKMGLTLEPLADSHKRYIKLNKENRADQERNRRLKTEKFKPLIEVIKLPKVNPKDKDLYISITRNTPLLFDVATKRKTSKDTFCLVTFAGLHQPTKRINSEAVKIISKFLKRKAFKVYRVDIAKDIKEPIPINKEGIKAFKERFNLYSNHGVTLEKTSYYINKIEHKRINTIIYYDKYRKATQKKEKVSPKDKNWKRLEVVLKFDVTEPNSHNFMSYINSMDFLDDFSDLEAMAKSAKIEKYSNDYLIYQLNSFIDNRFVNNVKSKEQFNSKKALNHFKNSDFRRYVLLL